MKEDFVTVKTFTYIHELAIGRGLLESEGIGCNVLDEFTVQANPLYSNAIGGIKLQVRRKDLERALKILEPLDNANGTSKERLTPFDKFDRLTQSWPLTGNIRFEFRFLIITALITLVSLALICCFN